MKAATLAARTRRREGKARARGPSAAEACTALVVTLTPAIYTVHATGVGGTSGVVLVEVYVGE